MDKLNRRLPQVNVSHFSMVPRSDVPRSVFATEHTHKTTFNAGALIPIHVDEVLPGDVHEGRVTVFARLATPLFPIMDNLHLETFFFFVPNRLVWENWERFCGEQDDPGDTIAYTIPVVQMPSGGWPVASLGDYFGLPTVGQIATGLTKGMNCLPLRGYNLIWNEWFRDENLQNSLPIDRNSGVSSSSSFVVKLRNKRHDYFTSALPWPLKGGIEVPIPLGATAPVFSTSTGAGGQVEVLDALGAHRRLEYLNDGAGGLSPVTLGAGGVSPGQLFVDLAEATGSTINALRLAVTTQQLLEKDARGGTRYTELLRNHFGVMPEDMRLQRPEYIGGGHSTVTTEAIPQTSEPTSASPLGALGAAATIAGQHTFRYHATEHGYIIGLVNVRADLTYQQGLHRMWTRETRYDFYWPVFANLGEQAIRNDEIFCQATAADEDVFGYQERWAEYRHRPSRISGLFRSTEVGTIDQWHLAQEFASIPVLTSAFMEENPPMERVLAAGALANNQEVLFDSVFSIRCTRAMPQYSVPGLTRF